MDEFKCNPFAARIVELFSEDGSGIISFQKFINIFSVFSPRATNETKTVWAFAIWDFDGVPPAQLLHILKVITAQPTCSRREEIQRTEPVLHMLAELSVVR